jgi:hypothetical protein
MKELWFLQIHNPRSRNCGVQDRGDLDAQGLALRTAPQSAPQEVF